MKRNWIYAALAAALAAAAVLGAVACGDDDDAETSSNASQQSLEELTTRVQRNEMVMAVLAISDLPFHDINESINDGEIPTNAIPSLRTLVRFSELTDWSADLEGAATKMHDDALELIDVIEANDIEQAKTLSTTVHEEYHQFTVDSWDVLAPGTGDDDHDAGATPDDHGSGTPAADDHAEDATPAMSDDHGDDSPDAEVTP